MEILQRNGVSRRIGLCNWNVQALQDILSWCSIPPYALQVELHPYLCQQALVDWSQAHGIRVVAFSPLGSGSYRLYGMDRGLGVGALEEGVVCRIAERVGKTPAQVVLRWNLQVKEINLQKNDHAI